jgi:hypothetical protein
MFDRNYMFAPRPSLQMLRDSTHAVKVNCILLSQGQYFSPNAEQIQCHNKDVGNIPKYIFVSTTVTTLNVTNVHPCIRRCTVESTENVSK